MIVTQLDELKVFSLEVQKEGQIIIPPEIINSWQINEGQELTLLLVGGLVLLVPTLPKVAALTRSFTDLMKSNSVSLDDLLVGLQEERITILKEQQNSAENLS